MHVCVQENQGKYVWTGASPLLRKRRERAGLKMIMAQIKLGAKS